MIPLYIVLGVTCLALSVSPAVVHASGELRLIKDGTTYYLSTTPASGSSTTVTTTTATTTTQTTTPSATISGTLATPPPGFAANFNQYLSFLLQIVMAIAILLVLFNLVMAGIEWITSGGDKGKVDQARQRIISTLIGVLILAASYAIFNLVLHVLGFDSIDQVLQHLPQIGAR